MDEVDIENSDDLNELEARLYAQIHHEPSGDCDFSATYKEAAPVRQVTATSVINNKSVDKTRVGRYWADKGNVRTTTPKQIPSSEVIQSGIQRPIITGGNDKKTQAETVNKTFRPPVKNLSNLRVNPFASGNDLKSKGSSSKTQGKDAIAVKLKKNDTKEKSNTGPFARQTTKLVHSVKYEAKKQKAKTAKAKANKVHVIDNIELLSTNESDTDDVIEVPLPPPKIVTIDSSSEDEAHSVEDTNNFVKPSASAVRETSSRCTSPCSVVSDDFIGQTDRSRLLKENERADDEDLVMLQEDVDSLMENPVTTPNNVSDVIDITEKTSTDYRVTQDEFRALDVYESESDIQESVYSKGAKKSRPSVVVRLDNESSSDSNDISHKTKRLRKRRASSSNKESESFIESSDSEHEKNHEGHKSREGVALTRLPYIGRGEALERNIFGDQTVKKLLVNSDNEFIATLNTLAQGTSKEITGLATESDSDDEEDPITARAIAENVIRRESCVTEAAEPLIVHDEEANDAIPSNSLSELSHVFNQIDSMNQTTIAVNESNDSDDSVELVAPLPVKKNAKHVHTKSENETGDPVYNIVYGEGVTLFGGIGWNEEMRKFYNNSWNGERFNVNAICNRMKATKSLWKIYTDDRFPKYRKHSHQKCINCCEFGHIRARCPKPRKPAICYMCGEKGHHEPRCPNTVCLRCGNKTRMFTKSCNSCNYQNRLICPICKVRGHSLNLCPDKWRRYHSTTKPNEYPNNQIEYKKRKFCCICGFHGHLAEHCRSAVRFTEYPLFISEIRSHQKSYDDISIKTIRSGIGYNLMYKPEEGISFELAENKTSRQYYGRFLIAVGMKHLLTRKRKVDGPTEDDPASKHPKVLREYVPNPFASAALEKSPDKSTPSISSNFEVTDEVPKKLTDVIEVESTSQDPVIVDIEDDVELQPSTSKISLEPSNTTTNKMLKSNDSTFKIPDKSSTVAQVQRTSDVVDIDSDSNYSFSEHFEPTQHQRSAPKVREMEPLPDFIPITDDGDDESSQEANLGISKRFVSADTDDDEDMGSSSMADIPSEAKIYLTNFHSKFLLSPDGNKFLVEQSKAFDIKASLDWTSVGHILVLFGIRANQDKFHTELLHRFRDLSDKLNRKQLENSQKVPKKTDVLIRFLREHINQLLSNLGNVNELFKRLNYQENQHTKSGWKSAEKTRRTLNMILIGQAGLRNGSSHLDILLSHLRNLIDDCKCEVVPNEMRDDIDSHWKVIFSSHRHDKYQDLVEAYNHMQTKNRLRNLNIDRRLLNFKVLDTTLTKPQKEKIDKSNTQTPRTPSPDKQSVAPQLVPNPMSSKNQIRQPKTPVSEKKRTKTVSASNSPQIPINSPRQQPQLAVKPSVAKSTPTTSPSVPRNQASSQKQKPQPKDSAHSSVANKIKAFNAEWETKFVDLLTEIDDTEKAKKGSPVRDSKASSMFWSREALKYIDECIQLGKSNASIMEKLSRVQTKSQNGLLSYNDYRAIIKIHNAIKAKK